MKIISVVFSIGLAGDAMWIRIRNIAKTFEIAGHKVDIIYYVLRISYKKYKLIHINLKRYETEYFVNSTEIGNPISIFFNYYRHIKKNDCDIIFGNTLFSSFFPILLKRVKNKPIILDMHGLPVEEAKLNKANYTMNFIFGKLFQLIAFKFSDKILCVSKRMVDFLYHQYDVPLGKLVYVTNGIDLDFFKEADEMKKNELKEQLGIKNKFVFGYVGGSQEWQGLTNLIEATKIINIENIIFIVVGGTENKIENNIIFISKAPQIQIIDYYSICDVLILPRPSHIVTEVAAPTKFAEYAAMGKPILTTNVGDAADFVRHYNNGIVVENNSPEILKKGILEFLTIEPNELIEMGKNSRKLAEMEFDWKKISKKLAKCLEEVATK